MLSRLAILLSWVVLLPCNRSVAEGVIAYRGGTIETVSKQGTIANGTVIVRNGVIESVGTNVDIPVNAQIIDVSGQTIMPALVDAYHPVNLSDGGSATSANRTIEVNGRTFTIPVTAATTTSPFLGVAENLDPASLESDLREAARYGVGAFNVVTRGYGQAAVARVTPRSPGSCLTVEKGVLFLAVTNSSSSLDVLRNGLKGRSSSGNSATNSASLRTSRSGGRPSGDAAASARTAGSAASSADSPTASLWKSAKSGESPLVLNVNNAATILYVLKICSEYKDLRLVLVADATDVYQTLDAIVASGVSVIIGAGLDLAPRSQDRINVAGMLEEANVPFAFSTSLTSSLSSMPDTPLFPVALLVKTGLSREKSLEALTIAPARMLGLEKTHGSVEAGKKASLLFVEGDPLSSGSRVCQVLVEGTIVYED